MFQVLAKFHGEMTSILSTNFVFFSGAPRMSFRHQILQAPKPFVRLRIHKVSEFSDFFANFFDFTVHHGYNAPRFSYNFPYRRPHEGTHNSPATGVALLTVPFFHFFVNLKNYIYFLIILYIILKLEKILCAAKRENVNICPQNITVFENVGGGDHLGGATLTPYV